MKCRKVQKEYKKSLLRFVCVRMWKGGKIQTKSKSQT